MRFSDTDRLHDPSRAMNDAFRRGLTIEDILEARYGRDFDFPNDADLLDIWRSEFYPFDAGVNSHD